jgi:hypothetical protein
MVIFNSYVKLPEDNDIYFKKWSCPNRDKKRREIPVEWNFD